MRTCIELVTCLSWVSVDDVIAIYFAWAWLFPSWKSLGHCSPLPKSGAKLNFHVRIERSANLQKSLEGGWEGRDAEVSAMRRCLTSIKLQTLPNSKQSPTKTNSSQCAVYFCHRGKEKERSVKCIEIISECLRRRGSGELGCEGRSVDERQTFTRSSASLHFKLLFPTLRVGYLQRSLLQHSLG